MTAFLRGILGKLSLRLEKALNVVAGYTSAAAARSRGDKLEPARCVIRRVLQLAAGLSLAGAVFGGMFAGPTGSLIGILAGVAVGGVLAISLQRGTSWRTHDGSTE